MDNGTVSGEPLTPQGVFDTVVRHLYTQGRRARRVDAVGCAYRGVDGTRCAIGCLLTAAEYRPSMEGLPCLRLQIPRLKTLPQTLLIALQSAHDTEDASDAAGGGLEGNLRAIAAEEGLEYRESLYPKPPAEWR